MERGAGHGDEPPGEREWLRLGAVGVSGIFQ